MAHIDLPRLPREFCTAATKQGVHIPPTAAHVCAVRTAIERDYVRRRPKMIAPLLAEIELVLCEGDGDPVMRTVAMTYLEAPVLCSNLTRRPLAFNVMATPQSRGWVVPLCVPDDTASSSHDLAAPLYGIQWDGNDTMTRVLLDFDRQMPKERMCPPLARLRAKTALGEIEKLIDECFELDVRGHKVKRVVEHIQRLRCAEAAEAFLRLDPVCQEILKFAFAIYGLTLVRR